MSNIENFRFLKGEEVEGFESMISCDRIFLTEDEEECKTAIYILSEDKTKLQTLEDFKNNNDNYVDFELETDGGVIDEFSKLKLGVDEHGNEIKAINVLLMDNLHRYIIDYGKVYSKVEDIEQFILDNNEELKEMKENELDADAIFKEMKAHIAERMTHSSKEDVEEL